MQKRNVFLMVLFTILTLGIYQLYWYCSFQNQLKKHTGQGFGGGMHLFVTIITLGIYAIVWQYKAGKRLVVLGAPDNAVLYLVLNLFGLGFLNPYIMQSQANNL